MTTAKPFLATPPLPADFQLPDPPDNPDDRMTNFDQMAATGGAHHLRQHLGNLDTIWWPESVTWSSARPGAWRAAIIPTCWWLST